MAKSKDKVVKKAPEKVKVPAGESFATMADLARMYIGQPVMILCARFNYRGILSAVSEDGRGIVLSNARAVESSGASNADSPTNEDVIQSSIVISIFAVEIIAQPNWVFAPLDS